MLKKQIKNIDKILGVQYINLLIFWTILLFLPFKFLIFGQNNFIYLDNSATLRLCPINTNEESWHIENFVNLTHYTTFSVRDKL
jgi:hypothetical protein